MAAIDDLLVFIVILLREFRENLDEGLKMHRTDFQGYVEVEYSGNTVWGSRQAGGSSGGPNLVNLGIPGRFDGNWMIDFNIVVGVTSWGYHRFLYQTAGQQPIYKQKYYITRGCGVPGISERVPIGCGRMAAL